jgi:hypothetical protein
MVLFFLLSIDKLNSYFLDTCYDEAVARIRSLLIEDLGLSDGACERGSDCCCIIC